MTILSSRPAGWAIDPAAPEPALAALLTTLLARPQLLGLGEPMHGTADFPRWRNRLFQALVRDHGYRSIALESDFYAGRRVNDFVLGGPDNLDEVMAGGFSHGFGRFAENRELVAWLRNFNAARPETDRVRFYGFDAPMENMWAASPRLHLLTAHAFLTEHGLVPVTPAGTIEDLCGEDTRWANEAAALDPAQSVGRDAAAEALRVIADDLLTLLTREAPGLQDRPDFWLAEMHARTALGLLRYHANMATPGPARVAHMLALRDLMMADTLDAVVRREEGRGPTLVFAHNSHLQRTPGRLRLAPPHGEVQWWGAGAHLSRRLGPAYAFIASTLGSGAGLPDPAPDTLEGHLKAQGEGPVLYAAPRLVAQLPASLVRRSDTSFAYVPLKPEGLDRMDGLLFLPTAES